MSVAAAGLFNTVPAAGVLGLLGPEGPDVPETVKFLGFSDKEMAVAASADVSQIRKSGPRMPAEVRERLIQIATVCELVASHFDDRERAALWFKTNNPMLGNFSPRDFVRFGRFRMLQRVIAETLAGL